jgi:hypothetical protein
MNRRAQLIAIWSGPLLAALFAIGAIVLVRFLPPWIHPAGSAQEVVKVLVKHTGRIRIGAVVMMVSMSLLAVWGAGLACQTRRREGSFPALTYVQLTNVAAGAAMIVVSCTLWMIACFRPGHIPASTTQTLVDAAYIFFFATWGPFTFWSWAVGAAILLDRSQRPVWPRWVGYLSFWAGLGYIPGFGVAFFKHGAFSWNGVLGLWCPCVCFFIWLLVMSWFAVKNVGDGYVYEEPEIDGSTGSGVVREPALRTPAPVG